LDAVIVIVFVSQSLRARETKEQEPTNESPVVAAESQSLSLHAKVWRVHGKSNDGQDRTMRTHMFMYMCMFLEASALVSCWRNMNLL
jgi:hypothetical protein